MRLFSQEVKDMNKLNEVLKNSNEVSKDYEVAVIVRNNKEQDWICLVYKGNLKSYLNI